MIVEKLSLGNVMATTTMRVRVVGMRRMRARVAVGISMIKLAARVLGCEVEVALACPDDKAGV